MGYAKSSSWQTGGYWGRTGAIHIWTRFLSTFAIIWDNSQLNIIIKNLNNELIENMACNDLLGIPKSPLLPLRKEEGLHHLNPFGELLFSPSWKWNQQHQPHCRPKMIQPHPTPSLKKDILLWYNISISSEQASLSSEVMSSNISLV